MRMEGKTTVAVAESTLCFFVSGVPHVFLHGMFPAMMFILGNVLIYSTHQE